MKKVLLLHGWTNRRPVGAWMRITATKLRESGHAVWYPQFPNPDTPDRVAWQELLLNEESQMNEVSGGEKIAIAHSLGCLNWLIAARTDAFEKPFDRVLFVAPPDTELIANTEDAKTERVNLRDPDVVPAIHKWAKSFTLLSSDKDRWLPKGIGPAWEEPLGVKAVIHEGAQHFSLDDGFGSWAGMLAWIDSANSEDLKLK